METLSHVKGNESRHTTPHFEHSNPDKRESEE